MGDWFRGLVTIERGQISFNRDLFKKALGKHHGGAVLILRPVEEFRTVQQNRYYWGVVIPELQSHPSFREWTEEQIHDGIKEKFLSTVDPKTGLVKAGSTANLTKEQWSQFKDAIQQWAAEKLDLYIPDPNEEAA